MSIWNLLVWTGTLSHTQGPATAALAAPAAAVPSSVVVAVRARPLGESDGAAGVQVLPPSSIAVSPGKSEQYGPDL